MTTMKSTSTTTKPRRERTGRARGAKGGNGATRLQVAVLVLVLGFYLGLFGLLPRLDAWRKGSTTTEKQNASTPSSNARVWVPPSGTTLAPPTPARLVAPVLPPLRVTPQPLAVITPAPLRLITLGTTGRSGGSDVQATSQGQSGQVMPAPVQVQPLPTLPPVQIQPLPTLAPLPPVAAPAPVVRSRGS